MLRFQFIILTNIENILSTLISLMLKYFKMSILVLVSASVLVSVMVSFTSLAVDPLKQNPVFFYRFGTGESNQMIGSKRTLPSPTTDEYAFYMNQLIAGPTFIERSLLGLKSSFTLTGPSNCGGANYLKFFNTTTKIMTFSFCKTITPYVYPEGVAGANIKAQRRAKVAMYRTLYISYISTDQSIRPHDFIIRNRDYSCFAPEITTQFSEKCE